MKIFWAASFALFAFAAGNIPEVYAEEKAATPPQIEMLDDSVLEKLVKASEISEQDQLLAPLEGTWYYEIKYWTKDGAEPQISSGTAKSELILNGKYLHTQTNLILNIGGQNIPYGGWGLLGYDAAKKSYSSIWADNLHTGFITGSGLYNEKLNAIEEKGGFKNPLDAKERSYRSVLQFIDGETYTQTFFVTEKSKKEFKALEITFERR